MPTFAAHDVMKNAKVERDLGRFEAHLQTVFKEADHVAAYIHLYTSVTMYGYKAVILPEQLGVPYILTFINLAKSEQKTNDYLKLNPNGKIPTIEYRAEVRAIFESGAILWHLAEKSGGFLSDNPVKRSETLQWLFFQVSGVEPMMGQAMYVQRIAASNGHEEPFSIKRYVDESRRLMEVLDTRLHGRD